MNFINTLRCVVMVLVSFVVATAQADVAVGPLFSDHMVLQQGMEVPVWGTAAPGEKVTVQFEKQSLATQADAQGKWAVHLAPLKAMPNQQGQKLTIAGSNTLVIDDVLVGEVWLGAGQSNMDMRMSFVDNAKAEIASANYPQIRFFDVNGSANHRQPVETYYGDWRVCTPKTVGGFQAAAYFFARELHTKLDVPVGIIIAAAGGVPAEPFVSREGLDKWAPEMAKEAEKWVYPGKVLDEQIIKNKQTAIDRIAESKVLAALEADLKTAAKTAAVDVDDSGWETVSLPKNWQDSDEGQFDGMHWFRKTVDVPADWAGERGDRQARCDSHHRCHLV